MLEVITPYAPLISAGSAFISAVAVFISTVYIMRKTRREKVDDLKFEIQFLLSEEGITGMSIDYIEEFLGKLEPKFQKEKYKKLHRFAFAELENEGRFTRINPYDFHTSNPG